MNNNATVLFVVSGKKKRFSAPKIYFRGAPGTLLSK
jgi:hypothetical protein